MTPAATTTTSSNGPTGEGDGGAGRDAGEPRIELEALPVAHRAGDDERRQ